MPVHRDQLRAQRSVSSMGSLYLYLFGDFVTHFGLVTWVDFGATVRKTVRPMLSDRCMSVCPVMSVTLMYCGQTVGRIKMKLGKEVGLAPGHIVLDGRPKIVHPVLSDRCLSVSL